MESCAFDFGQLSAKIKEFLAAYWLPTHAGIEL